MYESLYKQIAKPLCSITVFLGDELISEGSGFAINEDGVVFTAAHVITGRMPIQERDYKDPNAKIFVKFSGMDALEYNVGTCGINISASGIGEVVQIDQAVIFPKSPLRLPFESVTIGYPPELGEEVFFAGYSDELQVPFRIDKILEANAESITYGVAVRRGHRSDITGPMIKRGVVGNILKIETIEGTTGQIIKCSVFYIDNGIHSGASGGPIFNRQGQVIGVIVQRATTSAAQSADVGLEVPSGSTVGLSCLHTMSAMINRLQVQVQPS
jgi:hypothetical protein